MNPLAQAFAGRTPRERQLIAAAAAVILFALLVSVFEWVRTERARLVRALPEANAQLSRMQEDAAELLRLQRASPPPAVALPTLVDTARASAMARGLELVLESSGELVMVRGAADFDAVTDWLATLQAEQGLRPVRAQFEADGSQVRLDVALEAARTQ